jgi:hypothetical protein
LSSITTKRARRCLIEASWQPITITPLTNLIYLHCVYWSNCSPPEHHPLYSFSAASVQEFFRD